MKNILKNIKGVTLIELLVVLAILLIAIVLAPRMYIFGSGVFSKGVDQADVQQQIRMASLYINDDIRNSKAVELFNALPDPIDAGKNYIYVADNKIMHKMPNDPTAKEVLNLAEAGFTPNLDFGLNASNSEILTFEISGTVNDQDYSIESEIRPLNIDQEIAMIDPTGPWQVVSYTNPLTDDQITNIDAVLLSLKSDNKFLQGDDDTLMELLPPPEYPNQLRLKTKGENGSVITWISNKPSVINSDGIITRPQNSQSNEEVQMTATLSYGASSKDKSFTVNVFKLNELEITTTSLISTSVGSEYSFQFEATGGNGGYTFGYDIVEGSDDFSAKGLELNSNGLLTGIPTQVGTISFQVTVTDSHTSPNSSTAGFSLTISE